MWFCTILKDIFKPPLLVFFMTITGLAITLFSFSISMEINKNKIVNPDIQSWNSFYRAISSLGACFQSKSEKKGKSPSELTRPLTHDEMGSSEIQNMTQVSLLINASLVIDEMTQNGYFIKAIISAKDLGFSSSKDEVEITVSSPKSKGEPGSTCITLLCPSHLAPNVETVPPQCYHPKNSKNQQLSFVPRTKIRNKSICPSGHFGSLIIEEKPIDVYLNEVDISLIQMHIFATSSILCGIILIFFLYSLLGKFCRNDKKQSIDSKMVPLEL